MSETKTTYACGCTIRTVASGTRMAGTLRTYCSTHNPHRNMEPKVEVIA